VKILVDMNLSPTWVEYLAANDIASTHWSSLGDPKAVDRIIFNHAQEHAFVVFTHDLDFGNILAITHALGPSVIQARTEDPVPAVIGEQVVSAIKTYSKELERGALITLEPHRSRVRILPLVPGMKPHE
jgi:predicted nuclease of predicted toxin-antitoxin system